MAKIKPFKAVLYNLDKIKDLTKVTCPPYDVMDQKVQENCYNLSPYNIVRLILRKDSTKKANTQHTLRNNKYVCAKKELNQWLNTHILRPDNQEAIYFYEQEYVYLGEKKKRKGFIALLKIEDNRTCIHAHEHTQLAPKEDRLQLLCHVKANLSPIFVLFQDKNRRLRRIWDKCDLEPCLINISVNSVKHRLWRIIDNKIINELREDLKSRDIFIADGHHRYEVACNYRRQIRRRSGNPKKELDCDYVMTYFTDISSHALSIMPTHRVIKDIDNEIFVKIKDELGKYFDVYKAKDRADLFLMLGRAGRNEHALGMYKAAQPGSEKKNNFFLLRLKSGINIDKIININKPKEYKRLSVVILNQLILDKTFKFNMEFSYDGTKYLNKGNLFYTDDANLAIKMVDDREAKLAFFLNPIKVEQMTNLALQGERLPPKSTFFYPKLLSGLMIYKFNEDMS